MQRIAPIFLLFLFIFQSSLYAQETLNTDTITARGGEGIFAILRRSGRDPGTHISPFISLNKEVLKPDSTLVKGQRYQLPPVLKPGEIEDNLPASSPKETPPEVKPAVKEKVPEEEIVIEPLFGEKYEKVKVIDHKLKGAVYYLVAGHSGPDPGAIGSYGANTVSEDEYAYDVTLRLAKNLMQHGAIVYMIVQDKDDGIRDEHVLPLDTDERHYPDEEIPYSQRQRLRDRVNAVNQLYAKHKGSYQRMLAIHIDSRSKGENIDVFFYHHGNSTSGKKLAENIHQTFTGKYKIHQPSRDYQGVVTVRSSLYVVRYSHPPAVFIELGNIKNHRDQLRFILPDNRQALANWITSGILDDRKN